MAGVSTIKAEIVTSSDEHTSDSDSSLSDAADLETFYIAPSQATSPVKNDAIIVTPDNDIKPETLQFLVTPGISSNIDVSDAERLPSLLISTFLSDELFNFIKDCTNEKATRHLEDHDGSISDSSRVKYWKPVTIDEIKKFFGITLLMGLIVKPRLQDYWSIDPMIETPVFSSKASLSRDRFLLILRFLCYSSYSNIDKNDEFSKIRPFLSYVRNVCQHSYIPEKDICIDQVVLSKGTFKRHARTNNWSDKSKRGIRFNEICESNSGYLLNVDVYNDKSDRQPEYLDQTDFEHSERAIIDLCDSVIDRGYKIICDRRFSSASLANYLRQRHTHILATAHATRGIPCDLVNYPTNPSDVTFARTNRILWVKYVEKKSTGTFVTYLLDTESSASLSLIMKTVKGGKVDATYKPNSIIEYRQKGNGMKLARQQIESNKPAHKTYKWYHKCAIHYIQRLLLNAMLLNNKYSQKSYDMLAFTRLAVRNLLLETGEGRTRVSGFQSPKSDDHYLVRIPGTKNKSHPSRRCRVCSVAGVRRESRYQCNGCNAPLCLGECFPKFHNPNFK